MFKDKKGQVTIFIIIGIILLILVGFVFYIYGDRMKIKPKVKFDATQVEPLNNYVEQCIEKEGGDAIKVVSEHGGRVNPQLGYWYGNEKIAYLCYTNEFKSCENKVPFVRKEIEKEIDAYLPEKLKECIDLQKIESGGYDIKAGKIKVSTEVGDENVLVAVDYPLTISKGGNVLSQEKFLYSFKIPVGRMVDLVEDIVDSEILYGKFFSELYELSHPDVIVKIWAPVKTKIYTVKLRGEPIEFRFAVQGWVV